MDQNTQENIPQIYVELQKQHKIQQKYNKNTTQNTKIQIQISNITKNTQIQQKYITNTNTNIKKTIIQ